MNDNELIEQLKTIRLQNNDFAWLMSDYLNNSPDAITPELLNEVNGDGFLTDEIVCRALLTGFFDLHPDTNEHDATLVNFYLKHSVRKLQAIEYQQNPYYRNICIPETSFQNWKLTHTTYKPYELFVYNDIIFRDDFREIPRVGFFTEAFSFPAVHEDGREWMAIKPNEIETMRNAVDAVSGNVAVFGLGLGYYAYMISQKESVSEITIVERDKSVITLFETFILPQFEHKEKITIVQTDAFQFVEKVMPTKHFHYAFVDLWHDTLDGYPLYCKMKKMETFAPQTSFLYWIEDSLLSAYRWNSFEHIVAEATSYDEIRNRLLTFSA